MDTRYVPDLPARQHPAHQADKNMEEEHQAQVAFYLTGRRPADQLDAVDELNLRPALFARYRTLTELRYDFPLVLLAETAEDRFVEPLSGLIDGALGEAARGSDAERVRKHVLRLEQEIRVLVSGGASGTLATLWDKAAGALGRNADKSVDDSLKRARRALKTEGEMADCDQAMPVRLIRHGWNSVQLRKATAFEKNLARLTLKLEEILRSDFERSKAGRSAQHLQESVGSGHGDVFDFGAMSGMLSTLVPKDEFPESRRQRIRELIEVLGSQQFFPSPEASTAQGAKRYSFFFESGSAALEALRERMPKVVELARAIAIAELEIDGLYNEARHNALFEQFGANGLDPQDLAPFPDYLVCVNTGKMQAAEHAQLMEILSSGLPIKVLLQTDDILKVSPIGEGNLTSGMRSRQIANMAVGLNEVYVLQSSASNLVRFRDRILKGLSYRGPALFSVYSGASGKASGLSPYLMSAAAMESRAFPAFAYDPSAGPNWASRFYLEANPQVDLDWPVQGFAYEDEDHQSVSQDLAFTVVDFVACDRRYARHLARVPREKWNGSMIAVDESLTRERKGLPNKVPCLLMIDEDNALQKVIVDERLIREARRCREMWHSLQELGGVHNSHAEKLLARERKAWEERMQQEAEVQAAAALAIAAAAAAAAAASSAALPAAVASPVPEAATAVAAQAAPMPAPAAAPAQAEPEAEKSSDDAYIETPRCSTCDECTQINNKMFAYDKNKQAYIANIDAGTYAQLVEAAESCQVAVIHPGKPRNPNEPGLEELLKRAEPFL